MDQQWFQSSWPTYWPESAPFNWFWNLPLIWQDLTHMCSTSRSCWYCLPIGWYILHSMGQTHATYFWNCPRAVRIKMAFALSVFRCFLCGTKFSSHAMCKLHNIQCDNFILDCSLHMCNERKFHFHRLFDEFICVFCFLVVNPNNISKHRAIHGLTWAIATNGSFRAN